MAKFDTEDLLDSVLDIMVNGGALNAKINAIEAAKAAQGKTLDPVLQTISATAYYQQTWSDKILNNKVAIFYGIENVSAVENAMTLAKTYQVFVEVVLVDNGQTNDIHKRVSRYSRALEELFQEALTSALPGRVKVETVRPISFKVELDSDEEIKVGGISLTITLV